MNNRILNKLLDNIVVNCTTEQEAIEYLSILDAFGVKWGYTGERPLSETHWNRPEEYTCYITVRFGNSIQVRHFPITYFQKISRQPIFSLAEFKERLKSNNELKVIFLDIDGVLNSERFYTEKSQPERRHWAQQHGFNKDEQSALANIDPLAIELLNDIIDKTDAEIVVSSTWRSDPNLSYKLSFMGLKKPIYGITPYDKSRHRGTEIKEWIDYYKDDENVNLKYVIIDDDTDMLEKQKPFFFKTDSMEGLTEEIADDIIMSLNRRCNKKKKQ